MPQPRRIAATLARLVLLLLPMQTAATEPYPITFWRVEHLDGVANLDPAWIVRIHWNTFDISLPCFYKSYPFGKRRGVLRFEPASSTSICDRPGAQTGTIFERLFPRVQNIDSGRERTLLLDGDGRAIISLARLKADGIENRAWQVAEYRVGSERTALDLDTSWTEVTLMHGRVDGTLGCGGLDGGYALDGRRIRLDVGSFLAGWCSSSSHRQASALIGIFNGERHVSRLGERIILRSADRRSEMVLVPR